MWQIQPMRAGAIFLGFIVLLSIVVVATLTFVVGWDLTRFAMGDELDTERITVLRLDKFPNTEQRDEFYRLFLLPRARAFEEAGGQTLYMGTVSFVVDGRSDSRWDFFSVTEIPNGQVYLDTVTSAEYRLLQDQLSDVESSTLELLVNDGWSDSEGGRIVVVLADFAKEYSDRSAALIEGRIPLDNTNRLAFSTLTGLKSRDAPSYNFMAAYRFGSDQDIVSWLESDQRRTDFSILSGRLDGYGTVIVDQVL